MRENVRFRMPPNADNARKAWRHFFPAISPGAIDPEGNCLYYMLKRYVALSQTEHPDAEDRKTILDFADYFAAGLSELPAGPEQSAKLRQLHELVFPNTSQPSTE